MYALLWYGVKMPKSLNNPAQSNVFAPPLGYPVAFTMPNQRHTDQSRRQNL